MAQCGAEQSQCHYMVNDSISVSKVHLDASVRAWLVLENTLVFPRSLIYVADASEFHNFQHPGQSSRLVSTMITTFRVDMISKHFSNFKIIQMLNFPGAEQYFTCYHFSIVYFGDKRDRIDHKVVYAQQPLAIHCHPYHKSLYDLSLSADFMSKRLHNTCYLTRRLYTQAARNFYTDYTIIAQRHEIARFLNKIYKLYCFQVFTAY